MTRSPQFTDEDLTAYLDAQLELTRAGQLTAALKRQPALRKRLDALRIDTDQLRSTFDPLLAAAPPLSDLPKPRQFSAGIAVAACAAALVIGLLIGRIDFATKAPAWHQQVAAYQALYGTETLNGIETPGEAGRVELQRVADAIGRPLDFDVVAHGPVQGYKRAQILKFDGRPLVQLAYLAPDGVPFALCIMQSREGKILGMRHQNLAGLEAASWSDGQHDFLVIGGKDKAMISGAATHFSVALAQSRSGGG
jgi:anti-sigma factor RsiW